MRKANLYQISSDRPSLSEKKSRLGRSLQISNLLRAIVFSAFIFLCLSCGRKSPDLSGSHYIPNEDRESAEQILARAKVTCQNVNECPEGVGLIAGIQGNSVISCTAFLISDDLVLTERQCIPYSLRVDAISCKDKVRILFPTTRAAPAMSVDCKEVVSVSEDPTASDSSTPGYALLRLTQPVSRSALPSSNEGASDQAVLSNPYVESISQTSVVGEIRMGSCRARQNSVLLPSYRDSSSPFFHLTDCDTSGSHRGSPLINRYGRVIGLVQGPYPPSYQEALAQWMSEAPGSVGLGTNLRCAPTQGGGCAVNLSHANVRDSLEHLFAAPAGAEDAVLQDQLKNWMVHNQRMIKWKLGAAHAINSQGVKTLTFFPKPDCLMSPPQWLGDYRRFLGRIDQTTMSMINLPLWRYERSLDKYYIPTSRAVLDRLVLAHLSFSPSHVSRYSRTLMSLKSEPEDNREAPWYEGSIQVCSDKEDDN